MAHSGPYIEKSEARSRAMPRFEDREAAAKVEALQLTGVGSRDLGLKVVELRT